MGRAKVILLVVGGFLVAAAIESKVGSTRYELNGSDYSVPHKYEFTRNFRLPWLDGTKGLDKEPDESIWLLLPAGELARDVRGYSRMFHDYSSEVEADVVVNVLGGKEAREFAADRDQQIGLVADALAGGDGREIDKVTGWERIYSMRGQKGTPGDGGSLFYLIPKAGVGHLPTDWRLPSCQGSQDINGRETYDCRFIIYRNGLTFDFSLRQENLNLANRMPDYVMVRLNRWKN